ncbi:MAG: enhanced serine sensitivity protein SseB C-terminal domain-containing protein [Pirellulales bacterium]
MDFVAENDLERSLMRTAQEPAHRPQFIHDFLNSDVCVGRYGATSLAGDDAGEEKIVVSPDQPFSFVTVTSEGQTFLPIFTAVSRLKATLKAETPYYRLNAKELFNLVRGQLVILNPGWQFGKEFLPEEIERILDGSYLQAGRMNDLTPGTKILIGQPKAYPTQLVAALTKFCATKPQIRRAWVAHFHDPSSADPPHTLISLDIETDAHRTLGEAQYVASQVPIPDPPLDFALYQNKSGGLDDYFTGQTPFYQKRKKWFGLFG